MEPVVLAHQPDFTIGPLAVSPETRSVARDGRSEVIEPRVMQVLVVLAEAHGHVVARDDLVQRCWDGRIVGDDAINRIISRLRRLAEGMGGGVFAIETVTRVGYRLRRVDRPEARAVAPSDTATPTPVASRRGLLVGAVTGAALLAGAGGWWFTRSSPPPRDPQAQALMKQALMALSQNTREGQSQAAGILRRLVADDPDDGGAWGTLALVYAVSSHYRTLAEATALHQRARTAGLRALALEPGNTHAFVALTTARPDMGNWLDTQRRLRARLTQGGASEPLLRALAVSVSMVGRNQEALALIEQLLPSTDPTPGREFALSRALWAAGRLDEADLALARASELYPTHFAIWFARYYTFLYSGRQDAALAQAADKARHPSDIAATEIAVVSRVARASLDPTPAAVDAVIAEQLERARLGAGHAENAIQFAVLLGRPAVAAEILRAYYFSEGFTVPESRYGTFPGTSTAFNDRLTHFLFGPSLAPLHGTPDFRDLTARLGLDAYWKQSGTRLSARGVPID